MVYSGNNTEPKCTWHQNRPSVNPLKIQMKHGASQTVCNNEIQTIQLVNFHMNAMLPE